MAVESRKSDQLRGAVIVKPHISVLAIWLIISSHIEALTRWVTGQRSGRYWIRRGKYFVRSDQDPWYYE